MEQHTEWKEKKAADWGEWKDKKSNDWADWKEKKANDWADWKEKNGGDWWMWEDEKPKDEPHHGRRHGGRHHGRHHDRHHQRDEEDEVVWLDQDQNDYDEPRHHHHKKHGFSFRGLKQKIDHWVEDHQEAVDFAINMLLTYKKWSSELTMAASLGASNFIAYNHAQFCKDAPQIPNNEEYGEFYSYYQQHPM